MRARASQFDARTPLSSSPLSSSPLSSSPLSSSPLAWGFWLLFGIALLALGPTAAAQEDDTSQEESGGQDEGGSLEQSVDFGAIDDLLAEDEEVLTDPDTYSYDPGVRRDPFRSLIKKEQGANEPTKRPEGIAGLLIEELEIEGVFVLEDGPVVQVKSATEETSFLLRQGDELWDGDVVKITLEEVVFKQSVNDPTVIKPFREVVKKLSPAS